MFMHELLRVTVSVNSSDTLALSLRCSDAFVTKTIVITTAGDSRTQQLCAHTPRVRCHTTMAFHQNGDVFNKGRAINEVQRLLHRRVGSHILLLDADICVPKSVWPSVIRNLPRSDSVLLGVVNRCIYADALSSSYTRETHTNGNAVTSLGFFQLYMANTTTPLYPTTHPTAAVSDKIFANNFKKENRRRLPDYVNHLGRTGGWRGRVVANNSAAWMRAHGYLVHHPCGQKQT